MTTRRVLALGIWVAWSLGAFCAGADGSWQAALERMPLGTNVAELNETNCVKIMLRAFQSNNAVKALIFQPGAIDEFYWEHRAKARLTNDNPTLLDAVNALTNQTRIRVAVREPFLLLRTDADPLEPQATIKDAATARRIMQRRFVPHGIYTDRDWDFMQPILKRTCRERFQPGLYSNRSFHFYRHSFAAWDLTGWEALEAVSLTGKTKFTVNDGLVIFEEDWRGL